MSMTPKYSDILLTWKLENFKPLTNKVQYFYLSINFSASVSPSLCAIATTIDCFILCFLLCLLSLFAILDPWENLPYGILPTVFLFACTVITFARMEILQYFENGIQLLTCCSFIV